MVYLVGILFALCILSRSNSICIRIGNRVIKTHIGDVAVVAFFSLITFARAYSVGTDTINYYYSAESISHGYSSALSILNGYYIEPAYGILEYLIMRIFGDVHYLFLVEGIILITGLLSFIHTFNNKISIPLSFAVFFSFYFNTSLNISRQYLAVGIGFFAAKYLFQRKRVKYFLLSLLAMSFHATGIMLFFSYFISNYLLSDKIHRHVLRKAFGVGIIIISCCLLIKPISSLMVGVGLIPIKYQNMLHRGGEGTSSIIMTLLANSPLIILSVVYANRLLDYDERNAVAISLYFFGVYVSLLNTIFANVGRLALYWSTWQIVLFPECCEMIVQQQKSIRSKQMVRFIFYLFLFSYWVYCVIVRNFGETYPYVSNIWEWLNW